MALPYLPTLNTSYWFKEAAWFLQLYYFISPYGTSGAITVRDKAMSC